MRARDAASGSEPPGASTIPAALAETVRRHGDACAIATESGELSYRELAAAVDRTSRAARAVGIGRGDRVALLAPNTARWIVTALGVVDAGAVLVPLSTRSRGPELVALLARARVSALFTVRGFLGHDYPRMIAEAGGPPPGLRTTVLLDGAPRPGELSLSEFLSRASAADAAVPIAPGEFSDVLWTSGTTGTPKGVLGTHGRTVAVYRRWTEVTDLRAGDRYLLVNPFSHTFGYKAGLLACVLRGATMIPVPVFDPARVARLITDLGVTVITGPPTLFGDLLEHPPSGDHRLRLAGIGGAAVTARLVERIRAKLAVPGVFTGYGLTESTGVVTVCPPDAPAAVVAATVGPALPGTEVGVVDAAGEPVGPGVAGEIRTRGVAVAREHLHGPAALDPDGWLRTGDLGVLDARGYLRITGRLAETFTVGGFTVHPAEVEAVLAEHPGIREVAVCGVADPRLGEIARAVVVRADPDLSADAVAAWARQRIARHKAPRDIVFVDALPRNAAGKVIRSRLRDQ